MADVFISYKQDERSAIEQIATRLRALGLSIWFDASVSAGEAFSDEIDREARAAKAVLVCWSPAARESRWVKAEAMIGFEHDKLVACYVAGPNGFLPPTPFNTSHAEDLRAWLSSPSETHAAWKSVLRRVGRLCGRRDIESWGGLADQSGIAELRTWIGAHVASPLFRTVEALLRAREADDAERTRQEQKVRNRSAAEEADRRASKEAERKETIKALAVILPTCVLGVVGVLTLTVFLGGQQPQATAHPESWASYEGLEIGWSRDEVLGARGPPQLVLGSPDSDGVRRSYAVDEAAWPFAPSEMQRMPERTTISDYTTWVYTARENNGHEVHVGFDQRSAIVVGIACNVQPRFGQDCAPHRGVRIGDTEEQIVSVLGRPSRASSHEDYRLLRYDSLGVSYALSAGRTDSIAVFRPVTTAVSPPAPSLVERAEPDGARVRSAQPDERTGPQASSESTSIPATCEGQALPYQEDAVVTQIERLGATIVYTGRPVEYSSEFLSKRYVAYRDLGLAVGDTFCGYSRDGRRRIVGDGN